MFQNFGKIKGALGNLLAAVAVALFVGFTAMHIGHSLHDADSVHALPAQQTIKTFSGSINTETTVITGTSSTILHIYSMDISSSGAGVVVFKDGTGGTTILNVYCAANTPRELTNLFGSGGLALTQNILTATLSGATLTMSARVSNDAS